AALAFDQPPSTAEVRFASRKGEVVMNKDGKDIVRVVRWQPGSTPDARYSGLTTAGGEEAIPDPNDKSGRRITIPQFPVVVAVDNPDGRFLPGQRAYLRFDMEKK